MSARRIAIVILLTLLPWPAVWYGMYRLYSIPWTFFLYHGVCLLPAIIWGRRLWLPDVKRPSGKQWAILAAAAIATCSAALIAYGYTGSTIVACGNVMHAMTQRGFVASYLWPFAAYFIVVNSTLEELFWRGVVLNELDHLDKPWPRAGYAWTAITFAAWHYLVLRALLQPGYAELAVLGVLGVGLCCSYLYRRTKSIVLPIVVHAFVFDLAVIAIFWCMVAPG